MRDFTREQKALLLFDQTCSPFREAARTFPGETFSNFTNLFLQAVEYFGESELYIRQAERCEVLGIQPQRAAFCKQKFSELNDNGLTVSQRLLELVEQLESEFSGIEQKAGKKLKELKIEPYFMGLREVLVDMEEKKSDLEEINKELKDLEAFYAKKGFQSIPSYLEKRVNLLIKMRKSPTRGAEKNAAPWKVIAVVAILVVLGLAFFIHCGIFGCSVSSRNNYVAAMITVLFLIWC